MSNNTMVYEQIEELDVLKITIANGESFTAKVLNKLHTYCRLEYMGFTQSKYKRIIGQEFTSHYGTRVEFDGEMVVNIERVYRDGEVRESDILRLMELAVEWNDKEWFEELGKKLEEVKVKELEPIETETRVDLSNISKEYIIDVITQKFYYEDIVFEGKGLITANMTAKLGGADIELLLIACDEGFNLYDKTIGGNEWVLVGKIEFGNEVM